MSDPLAIDTNIPMPQARRDGNGLTATLQKLNVGDSFLYPEVNRASIYSAVIRGRLEIKVSTRSAGEGMIRVWRIA